MTKRNYKNCGTLVLLHGKSGKLLDLSFFKNKRILITGHTGFKGSWLCKILELSGATLYGYSLDPPTEINLYTIANIEKSIISERGDVSDFDHLFRFFKKASPEIVLHLAAQPLVKESYIHPLETYQSNVMGTVSVMECLRRTNSVKSFLNVTTDKVYNNLEIDKYYKESDSLDGYDPYSNSKSCSELVTHSYKRSFFQNSDCCISTARAGNVIGGGDFAKDRIIPDCIRAAISHKDIVLRHPNSIRPYQHVLEPLAAYLTIIESQYKDKNLSGSYNVGPRNEDCVTTGQLATLFCDKWGDNLKWISPEYNGVHEANFLKLDSSLIQNKLSFYPRWSIKEAVDRTIDWTKSWIANEDINAVMAQQISDYFGDSL